MAAAAKLDMHLSPGYLFCPVVNDLVLDSALTYSSVYERLKFYINVLNMDEGETPPSFRGACALSFKIVKSSRSATGAQN